jgi:hypothetical protein
VGGAALGLSGASYGPSGEGSKGGCLLARQRLGADADADARALVDEALDQALRATDELRELAHGIIPAVLTRGGLSAGVDSLASRMPLPVSIDVPATRFPAAAEATAYFVVAEGLTNVAKHARAQRAGDDRGARPAARRGGATTASAERCRAGAGSSGCRTGSRAWTDGSRWRARPAAAR